MILNIWSSCCSLLSFGITGMRYHICFMWYKPRASCRLGKHSTNGYAHCDLLPTTPLCWGWSLSLAYVRQTFLVHYLMAPLRQLWLISVCRQETESEKWKGLCWDSLLGTLLCLTSWIIYVRDKMGSKAKWPGTQEAEAGRLLWVWGQPELHSMLE